MKDFKKNIYRTVSEDVDPCADCVYKEVIINDQIWTGCNATTEFYNNGDPIPRVDNTAEWAALTTGAWCWYGNDPYREGAYGKLYNWYAVNDPRGIAPAGYRVPTDTEYLALLLSSGLGSEAGGKMKEEGLCHWASPNTGATNTSKFTGLPGGFRFYNGAFFSLETLGYWWSSTPLDVNYAQYALLTNTDNVLYRNHFAKTSGLSLRFIKDPVCTDINNHVTIGTQTWTLRNSDVVAYSDGTNIPEEANAANWTTLTTGAWCHVNNNPANDAIYGRLYNWYAIAGIYDAASLADPLLRKQFAPNGYHVPSDTEIETLITSLGGTAVAGKKMKVAGTAYWSERNYATNSSCFSALGTGYRTFNTGAYVTFNTYTYWWSSTDLSIDGARTFYVRNDTPSCELTAAVDKNSGFSVRLIKD